MQKVRVLVVDDHSVVRAGVRMLVDAQPDMEVVGEAAEGEEAVAKVGELMPDVVLMDIHMPGVNGLQATRQIKKRFPQVCVLALTMYDNEEYFFEMLSAGGSGYVLKNAAPSELVSAIRAVHKGGSYLYPTVARALVDDYLGRVAAGDERTTYNVLTNREKGVLKLIAQGHTNRDMAELLHLSIKTVETHRANIMQKLGLHSRTELVKYALRKGLVDIED